MKLFNLFCPNREFRNKLEENRERLYRMAYAWCHDPFLADDLVQETLEKALKNANQLRDIKAIHSWLFKIMANCWRDHFRGSRNMVNIDYVELSSKRTPEDEYEQQSIILKVREAVVKLSEKQRQVLTLVDLEGFSYIEVADVLEIPIGTVMSRLCRARRALKEILFDYNLSHKNEFTKVRRIK